MVALTMVLGGSALGSIVVIGLPCGWPLQMVAVLRLCVLSSAVAKRLALGWTLGLGVTEAATVPEPESIVNIYIMSLRPSLTLEWLFFFALLEVHP